MSHVGERAADVRIVRPWVLVLTMSERSDLSAGWLPRWLWRIVRVRRMCLGTVGATRPMGSDRGGHGMKIEHKRGAGRLVRWMAKGVRPMRMEVDCSGGELSSNGGSVLMMMVAEQVQLFERVSACFTDHRDPSKVAHPLEALLGQRILGLALGYEDVNDHDELRRDRVLSTAMERVECARSDCEPLAGKSTLNRMELSANGPGRAKARQITVDFDALDELLVELVPGSGRAGAGHRSGWCWTSMPRTWNCTAGRSTGSITGTTMHTATFRG